MDVEYVSCKISAITWLQSDFLKNNVDSDDVFWMFGTYSSSKNFLSIYGKKIRSDDKSNKGIGQIDNLKFHVPADVVSIANYDKRSSFVSLSNEKIFRIDYTRKTGFKVIHEWSVDAGHHSTALLVNTSTELISSGLDGRLLIFDINSKKINKTPSITSNSVHCLDNISENEIVCGTTSGHVKLFDKRSQKVEMSIVNETSIITSIKRNSHLPHIIACGNDLGFLYLWDLRNSLHRPMQPVSGHTASISGLKYMENEPNFIITSSLDGQLIKWNITNEFEIVSVDSLIDKRNKFPINCFDINQYSNQILFADDNEVLYCTTI
ncbi:zinc finger protein castor 1-like [Sarcoptes scabiei]|nr:zinc finger protein castor 1-like [Sarcoptes scabiei]